MTVSGATPESLFELGRLYSDRGDFFEAIAKLQNAAEGFLQKRDFSQFLKSQNLLLRLYAETEQEAQIHAAKERLQDLVLKEGFELNSKTYYTLALCASFKSQEEIALDYAQKALAIALANDSKEDICYAISATALIYFGQGRLQEALKEIYNLQIFFEVISLPDVKISTLILNSMIMTELKKFDQAVDVLWQAYELIKEQKNFYLQTYLLANMGKTYRKAGDKELARLYLSLAAKTVDPKNHIRLARVVDLELAELGYETKNAFDLVFDLEAHTVTERKLGKVDFKNQFILLDLLKLFLQNQGQVYSKEYLVEQVWKQDYDPAVHDNKIYVTIKRLRKMIEPDFDKPKYIFRAKNGYYMNKSARVHIERNNEGGLQ